MRLETVQDRPGPRVIEPPVLLIEIGVSRPFEEQQEGYRQRNVECAPVAGAKRTDRSNAHPDEHVGKTGTLLQLEIDVGARGQSPEMDRHGTDDAESQQVAGEEKLAQPALARHLQLRHPRHRIFAQALYPLGWAFLWIPSGPKA